RDCHGGGRPLVRRLVGPCNVCGRRQCSGASPRSETRLRLRRRGEVANADRTFPLRRCVWRSRQNGAHAPFRGRVVLKRSRHRRLGADNVACSWSPRALVARNVRIDMVDASYVSLQLKPGPGISAPPASLALPWQIDIQRASIAHFDVESGENRWRFARLAFHYTGGSLRHGLDELAFDSEWGALRGNIALDASRPFAATGTVAFAASDKLHRASASLA